MHHKDKNHEGRRTCPSEGEFPHVSSNDNLKEREYHY